MAILNVAEKNDAAKAIAGFLSNGHAFRKEGKSKFNKIYEFKYNFNGRMSDMIMTSVSGHMMNLAFPFHLKNWESVNPATLFESPVNKICTENMVLVKKSLEEQIRYCDMLIIWTDCDREGENIGVEIVDVCKAIKSNIIVKRAKFSEITKQSVNRAINNLVDINMKLSQAVDVRQELDLKSGAAFTRLQTLFLRKKFPQLLSEQIISYGSCQFPTLGFVVERYKEVENFISEPFWKIVLTHEKKQELVEFIWDRGRLFDERLVLTIKDNITIGGSLALVVDVTNKPKSKWRPVAMDTIEMEKLSSRKLKINPKTTMQIAEKLYSKGYISYPRTETNIFPKEMNLNSLVETQVPDNRWGDFASNLLANGINPHNGKKSDKAHPPIHPLKLGTGLSDNEARLFELITRHFLACLSKNALGQETKILIDCISKCYGTNNWPIHNNRRQRSGLGEGFSLTGLAILERNYLEVYPYDKWSDKEVPVYEIGEVFTPTSITVEQSDTSAPSLLTEADLISLMDKHGIGTDATHAEHIDKVKLRDYVGNTGPNMMYLIPGKLGMGLVEGYDLMGFYLSRPILRSSFETDLEKICEGLKQPNEVLNFHLNEYKSIFLDTVNHLSKLQEGVAKFLDEAPNTDDTNLVLFSQAPSFSAEIVRSCLFCDGMINIKKSNANAWYLGCSKYPNCRYALWLPSTVDNVILAISPNTEQVIECQNSHENTRNIPVNKISIKFNIFMGTLADVFPDDQRRFVVCLFCNTEACETLDIRHPINKQPPPTASVFTLNRVNNPNQKIKREPFENKVKHQPISQSTSFEFPKSSFNQTAQISSTVSSPNKPVCHCGQVAVSRKVNKDGPNKDKLFYACPSQKCKMFAWADNFSATNESPRNVNANNLQHQNTEESLVKCKCGVKANLLTVKKENQNKGRQFYACSQTTRCDFFQWSDETRSLNDTTPKMIKKRPGTFSGEHKSQKKAILTKDSNWPPSGKDFSVAKTKPRAVRCCTVCKCPGHTAKNCSMR